MLFAQHFLKQGLQVGPWRVTRKVLLFITAFCIVVLAFGALMLETHAFDADCDDDDDGSYERYDDDDDYECYFGGGDMVMMAVMVFAGIGILVALLACCFAQVNPPSHLESRGAEQVFTIQLTKPSIGPQHPEALSHYQHYHLQQQQQFEQQYRQQQQQQPQQMPNQQMQQSQQMPQMPQSQQMPHQQQLRPPQSQQVQRSSSRPNSASLQQQRPGSQGLRHARSPPPPYSPTASDPNSGLPSDNPPPYSP